MKLMVKACISHDNVSVWTQGKDWRILSVFSFQFLFPSFFYPFILQILLYVEDCRYWDRISSLIFFKIGFSKLCCSLVWNFFKLLSEWLISEYVLFLKVMFSSQYLHRSKLSREWSIFIWCFWLLLWVYWFLAQIKFWYNICHTAVLPEQESYFTVLEIQSEFDYSNFGEEC